MLGMQVSAIEKKKICLVEDDIKLASLIETYLDEEGFDVNVISDGLEAIDVIKNTQPDAVLLDVMLPGADGVEVCRKLNNIYKGPVLMLTASENEYAEIAALNFGADKFLHKPLKPQVLLAHLNSSLARIEPVEGMQAQNGEPSSPKGLSLNHDSMEASLCGADLHLSPCEFKLLALLHSKSGHPFQRDDIYLHLRGIEYDGIDRYVDLKVSSLRKKLGDTSPPFKVIKTMRNQGYLLSEKDLAN